MACEERCKESLLVLPDDVDMTIETILAPSLVSFAVWVIRSAKDEGIKDLFFLARDAYPAFRIASILCKKYCLGIDCHYFYCSRFSLRMPMYSENIEEAIDYICRDGIEVTIEKVLRRAGLCWEEMQEETKQSLTFAYEKGTALTRKELEIIGGLLKRDRSFTELLEKKSKSQWPITKAYFSQEGLFGDNVAIVDSGWVGTTQKSINDIRRRAGIKTEVKGYYFGLFDLPAGVSKIDYRCFYFEPGNHFFKKLFFSNCFLETVYSSKEHGTTCGYMQKDDHIEPVLAEANIDKWDEAISKKLLHYAETFAEKIDYYGFYKQAFVNGSLPCRNSLSRLMWHPTKTEAEVFGSMSFSDDLLDDLVKPLAPIMGENQLRENHLIQRCFSKLMSSDKAVCESGWLEGSAVRSSGRPDGHLISFLSYKAASIFHQMLKYHVHNIGKAHECKK